MKMSNEYYQKCRESSEKKHVKEASKTFLKKKKISKSF